MIHTGMKLEIEVRRNRISVTQGFAEIWMNGERVLSFGDEIEIICEGERFYGPLIGGWASRKPDSDFIIGAMRYTVPEGNHMGTVEVGRFLKKLKEQEKDAAKIREKGQDTA